MLIRWLLVALGLVLVTGLGAAPVEVGPRVVGAATIGERLVELTVASPAMGGRELKVRLLTPRGWERRAETGRSWPTLWLLHGCCGDEQGWSRHVDLAAIADLRGVLVVMPDGGWNGWYSDWWDSGRVSDQRWETFHLTELRGLLEDRYGAGDRRAIAGLSMGGQGALAYAARHPGLFAAAASYSGTVHPLLSQRTIAWRQSRFASRGDDPDRVWGDPVTQGAIWEAHDPVHLAAALAPIPVYLSCGDGDAGPFDPVGSTDRIEGGLIDQNHALAAELRRQGATRLTTHFYGDGHHRWSYWEREFRASLPMLLAALRTAH